MKEMAHLLCHLSVAPAGEEIGREDKTRVRNPGRLQRQYQEWDPGNVSIDRMDFLYYVFLAYNQFSERDSQIHRGIVFLFNILPNA